MKQVSGLFILKQSAKGLHIMMKVFRTIRDDVNTIVVDCWSIDGYIHSK